MISDQSNRLQLKMDLREGLNHYFGSSVVLLELDGVPPPTESRS